MDAARFSRLSQAFVGALGPAWFQNVVEFLDKTRAKSVDLDDALDAIEAKFLPDTLMQTLANEFGQPLDRRKVAERLVLAYLRATEERPAKATV